MKLDRMFVEYHKRIGTWMVMERDTIGGVFGIDCEIERFDTKAEAEKWLEEKRIRKAKIEKKGDDGQWETLMPFNPKD